MKTLVVFTDEEWADFKSTLALRISERFRDVTIEPGDAHRRFHSYFSHTTDVIENTIVELKKKETVILT